MVMEIRQKKQLILLKDYKMEQNFKKFYSGKKVLVTGADGFIGSHLTERLLRYNALVSVFVHNEELKNLKNVKEKLEEVIVGDVADERTTGEIIRNNPKIIFHLAADDYIPNSIKNPWAVLRTNLKGTVNVSIAAQELMKDGFERLVYTSSCVVYGTNLNPMKEDDLFKPNTPYAASKAAADLLCHAYYNTYNLPVAIIRPFNTYGPRKTKDVIPLFIGFALSNKEIGLDGGGKATRDFIYVDDAIDGFLIMGMDEKAVGEAVNFGMGKDISIKDLTSKIINYTGSKSNIVDKPERPGQDMRSCCDNTKARTLFGWQPKISIDEGLKKNIEWYKENV